MIAMVGSSYVMIAVAHNGLLQFRWMNTQKYRVIRALVWQANLPKPVAFSPIQEPCRPLYYLYIPPLVLHSSFGFCFGPLDLVFNWYENQKFSVLETHRILHTSNTVDDHGGPRPPFMKDLPMILSMRPHISKLLHVIFNAVGVAGLKWHSARWSWWTSTLESTRRPSWWVVSILGILLDSM